MYDLNRREVLYKFRGHKQETFILKCSFGGVNDSFVVMGSEDQYIYIWSKEKGELVTKLEGHT